MDPKAIGRVREALDAAVAAVGQEGADKEAIAAGIKTFFDALHECAMSRSLTVHSTACVATATTQSKLFAAGFVHYWLQTVKKTASARAPQDLVLLMRWCGCVLACSSELVAKADALPAVVSSLATLLDTALQANPAATTCAVTAALFGVHRRPALAVPLLTACSSLEPSASSTSLIAVLSNHVLSATCFATDAYHGLRTQAGDAWVSSVVKGVISANAVPPDHLGAVLGPLLVHHTSHAVFADNLLPDLLKALKRSSLTGLHKLRGVLERIGLDLSRHAVVLTDAVLPHAVSDDAEKRALAVTCFDFTAKKSSEDTALKALFDVLLTALQGKRVGALALIHQRISVFHMLQHLTACTQRVVSSQSSLGDIQSQVVEVLAAASKKEQKEEAVVVLLDLIGQTMVLFSDSCGGLVAPLNAFLASPTQPIKVAAARAISRVLRKCPKTAALFGSSVKPLTALVTAAVTRSVARTEGTFALQSLFALSATNKDVNVSALLTPTLSDKSTFWDPTAIDLANSGAEGVAEYLELTGLISSLTQEHASLLTPKAKALCTCVARLCIHASCDVRRSARHTIMRLVMSPLPQATEHIAVALLANTSAVVLPAAVVDTARPHSSAAAVRAWAACALCSVGEFGVLEDALCEVLVACHHPAVHLPVPEHAPAHVRANENASDVWQLVSAAWARAGHETTLAALVKAQTQTLVSTLVSKDHLFSSDPHSVTAAIRALACIATIAPEEVVAASLGALIAEIHEDKVLGLNDYEQGVWETPMGSLYLDNELRVRFATVAAEDKNKRRDKSAKKMYDVEDEEWEEEERRKQKVKGVIDPNSDEGKARAVEQAKQDDLRTVLRQEQVHHAAVLSCAGALCQAAPEEMLSSMGELMDRVRKLIPSTVVGTHVFLFLCELCACVESQLRPIAPTLAHSLRAVLTNKQEEADEAAAQAVVAILDAETVLSHHTFLLFIPLFYQISNNLQHHESGVIDAMLTLVRTQAAQPVSPVYPATDVCAITLAVLKFGERYTNKATTILQLNTLQLDVPTIEPLLAHLVHPLPSVRLACLQALQELPRLAARAVEADDALGCRLWVPRFDAVEENKKAADVVWELYSHTLPTTFVDHLAPLLAQEDDQVREMVGKAFGAATGLVDIPTQTTLSAVFNLTVQQQDKQASNTSRLNSKPKAKRKGEQSLLTPDEITQLNADNAWLEQSRRGLVCAVRCCAEHMDLTHVPVVFTFLVLKGLGDTHEKVRAEVVTCGVHLIDHFGAECVPLLLTKRSLEGYLASAASMPRGDFVRQGVVVFMGALGKHLPDEVEQLVDIANQLIDTLSTPSEDVKEAASACLIPLMPKLKNENERIIATLMEKVLDGSSFNIRRGGAFGLAGAVKGIGLPALRKYAIMDKVKEAVESKGKSHSREGALMAVERLYVTLGRLFEPYIVAILPMLLSCSGDNNTGVREATNRAARVIMANLTVHGVKMVMPNLLKTLEEKNWRTRVAAIELLGSMAYCAPKQLSQCLPQIVPALTACFSDTHPKVQSAVKVALQSVGSVIKSPEITALVPLLLKALEDPTNKTAKALDSLMHTAFVNCVDPPSLALIVPVLKRGLKENNMETKHKTAQVVGSICSLITNPKDILPYLPALLDPLKLVLVDPIPEVRTVAAKAMGSLIAGLGEANFAELVPWLIETMQRAGSQVERSGAAQGLSQVLLSLGIERVELLMPEILKNVNSPHASVREGNFSLLMYLPTAFGSAYEPFVGRVLPALLQGLADDNESVRETAFVSGKVTVNLFAFTALDQILPSLEEGLFDERWRIRFSSVQLLGNFLFRVVGASGKGQISGADEGISTHAQNAAIIRVLGKERRDGVLSALFVMRSDLHQSVKTESLHVWKTVVVHTPQTLMDILPSLIDVLIRCLASPNPERKQVAAHALGDMVRRLGDRVLPALMPIFEEGLNDQNAAKRQGVCLGLSELMKAASRTQVQAYLEVILPAVRTALCDQEEDVRAAAAETFNALHHAAGSKVLDDIVPTLMQGLYDDATFGSAVHGLCEILRQRATALFPYLYPRLLTPISVVHANTLAAVVGVSEPPLHRYLDNILPALYAANHAAEDNEPLAAATERAAKAVVCAVNTQGMHLLLGELSGSMKAEEAYERKLAAVMVGAMCEHSEGDWDDDIGDMMEQLALLFADTDADVVNAAVLAMGKMTSQKLNKDQMARYTNVIRAALSHAREAVMDRDPKSDGTVPGLCLPNGVLAVLPLYADSLLSTGNTDVRQAAASGIGELVAMSQATALRTSVLKMAGPLIRIFGERCTWQVKAAILHSLSVLLQKGGLLLKPFVPQLQPTFVKALKDPTKLVRDRAVAAIEWLAPLSPRLESLLTELLTDIRSIPEVDVRVSLVAAVHRIVVKAGPQLKTEVLLNVVNGSAEALAKSPPELSTHLGLLMGSAVACVQDEAAFNDLLQKHVLQTEQLAWEARLNRACALRGLCTDLAADRLSVLATQLLPSLTLLVEHDKVPVRQEGVLCMGTLVTRVPPAHPNHAPALGRLLPLLKGLFAGQSSEMRTTALTTTKLIAKTAPKVAEAHLSSLVPPILACVKERDITVKLAAERCLLHLFGLQRGKSDQLTKYLAKADDAHAKELSEYAKRVLSRLADESDSEGEDE